WTQPCHGESYGVRVEAIEPDEVARKVDDSDRVAHVKDVDVSRLRVRARFENQTDGLGDGHEVSGGVGLGDGQRQPVVELALQQRNDTPARSKDVSEPYRGIRASRPVTGCDGELLR